MFKPLHKEQTTLPDDNQSNTVSAASQHSNSSNGSHDSIQANSNPEDSLPQNSKHDNTEKDDEHFDALLDTTDFIPPNEHILYSIAKAFFSVTTAACVFFLYYDATRDLDTDDPPLHYSEVICGIITNILQTLLFTSGVIDFFVGSLTDTSELLWKRIAIFITTLLFAALGDVPYGAAEQESDHTVWKTAAVEYGNYPLIAFAVCILILKPILEFGEKSIKKCRVSKEDYRNFSDLKIAREILANFLQSAQITQINIPYTLSNHQDTLNYLLKRASSNQVLFNVAQKNGRYYAGECVKAVGSLIGVGGNPGYTCSSKNSLNSWPGGIAVTFPIYIISYNAGKVFRTFFLSGWDFIAFLKQLCTGEKKWSDIRKNIGDLSLTEILLGITRVVLGAGPGIFSQGTALALLKNSCPDTAAFQNIGMILISVAGTNASNSYWGYMAVDEGCILYQGRFGNESTRLAIHSQRNFEKFCQQVAKLTQKQIADEIAVINAQRPEEWRKFITTLSQKEAAAIARIMNTSAQPNAGLSIPISDAPASQHTSSTKNGYEKISDHKEDINEPHRKSKCAWLTNCFSSIFSKGTQTEKKPLLTKTSSSDDLRATGEETCGQKIIRKFCPSFA